MVGAHAISSDHEKMFESAVKKIEEFEKAADKVFVETRINRLELFFKNARHTCLRVEASLRRGR